MRRNRSTATRMPRHRAFVRKKREAEKTKRGQNTLDGDSHLFSLPPVGGSRHDLTIAQRMAMMGQVALVSVVGLAAIVTVMVGILSLLGR